MPRGRVNAEPTRKKRGRPSTTREGREAQLIALATDLAEKQLMEGSASSQVVTHFLKLGSTRETKEQERLASENELLKAKIEAVASAQRVEELYSEALNAMKTYSGQDLTND